MRRGEARRAEPEASARDPEQWFAEKESLQGAPRTIRNRGTVIRIVDKDGIG